MNAKWKNADADAASDAHGFSKATAITSSQLENPLSFGKH